MKNQLHEGITRSNTRGGGGSCLVGDGFAGEGGVAAVVSTNPRKPFGGFMETHKKKNTSYTDQEYCLLHLVARMSHDRRA